MVSDLLVSILLSDSGITDITRTIHPASDPQHSPRPKLTYQLIDGEESYDNDGVHLHRFTYVVDCWANTYKETEALARAVASALSLYCVAPIRLITIQSNRDVPATQDYGKEKPSFFRKSITVRITK